MIMDFIKIVTDSGSEKVFHLEREGNTNVFDVMVCPSNYNNYQILDLLNSVADLMVFVQCIPS